MTNSRTVINKNGKNPTNSLKQENMCLYKAEYKEGVKGKGNIDLDEESGNKCRTMVYWGLRKDKVHRLKRGTKGRM